MCRRTEVPGSVQHCSATAQGHREVGTARCARDHPAPLSSSLRHLLCAVPLPLPEVKVKGTGSVPTSAVKPQEAEPGLLTTACRERRKEGRKAPSQALSAPIPALGMEGSPGPHTSMSGLQGWWGCAGGTIVRAAGHRVLLHMERLTLGWVLLLGTWTATSAASSKKDHIKEVEMDRAPNCFDDQYQGCIHLMEAELAALNRTKFNNTYAHDWRRAATEWQSRWSRAAHPPVLGRDQATAVLAYMMQGNLYHQFNAATLTAGLSRQHYLHSYPFKALHFLLSRALQTLRESQPQRCFQVYRGVRGIRYTAQQGKVVRFGQFTSSSLQKNLPGMYGPDTFFSVETCYGAPIQNFTTFPGEDKVLIPPFEHFRVTNITNNRGVTFIQLRSQGKTSTYNCEFVKEKRCKGRPCAFSAGRSSPMEPPHLWGLLLAAAALVAVGDP